jgi:hypothetical protein
MASFSDHGHPDAHPVAPLAIADGLVSVTQQDRARGSLEEVETAYINARQYAPAGIRDQFLAALELKDRKLATELAGNLTGCSNPLPGMSCIELGVPAGSTYGCAARRILGQKNDR